MSYPNIRGFWKIKYEYIDFFGESEYKFQWIKKFENYHNKEKIFLTESSIEYIKLFVFKYGLNLEEYIYFLKN